MVTVHVCKGLRHLEVDHTPGWGHDDIRQRTVTLTGHECERLEVILILKVMTQSHPSWTKTHRTTNIQRHSPTMSSYVSYTHTHIQKPCWDHVFNKDVVVEVVGNFWQPLKPAGMNLLMTSEKRQSNKKPQLRQSDHRGPQQTCQLKCKNQLLKHDPRSFWMSVGVWYSGLAVGVRSPLEFSCKGFRLFSSFSKCKKDRLEKRG